MRLVRGWLALSAVVCVLSGMAAGADEPKEGKVSLDKVPKAVLKAVKAKFKGAEMVSASTENDNGKVVYEIVIKDKGQSVDVSVSPEGKILSYERTITDKDLPRPVRETLGRKYPQAEYKRIEEFTEDDRTSFEVLLVTSGKKTIEVVLDRKGKVLKETEEKK